MMQTELSRQMSDMIAAGQLHSAPAPSPEEQEKKTYRDDLQAFIDAAEIVNPKINHNKTKWKDLPDSEKMAICTRTTGRMALLKMPSGLVSQIPINCNLCGKCYQANADKLKTNIAIMDEAAKEHKPSGQWRKKIVDEGKEAQSLKKHIKRNQQGAHFEIACETSGKSEVWAYVEDEPGKDMDEIYGKTDEPDSIDTDKLYALNRSTGKKLSKGAAFRKSSPGGEKLATERIAQPEIILKDTSRQDEATAIIEATNYIELARDANHAARLYTFQFKYILAELNEAAIEVAAINIKYFNMDSKQLLNDWNSNIKYWMSINTSLQKSNEDNLYITKDVSRLVYPKRAKRVSQ